MGKKDKLTTRKPIKKTLSPEKPISPPDPNAPLSIDDLHKIAFELDVKKKLADLQEKEKIVNNWEDTKIKNDLKRISHEKNRVEIDKIYAINRLIESITINEEKTNIGSEPVFKNTYDGSEQMILKKKIFEILKKI